MRRIRKFSASRELLWSVAAALSIHATVMFGPFRSGANSAKAREPKPEEAYLEVSLATSAPAVEQAPASTPPTEPTPPPVPVEPKPELPPEPEPPAPLPKPEAIVAPEPPPLPPPPAQQPAPESVKQPALTATQPLATNRARAVGEAFSPGPTTATNALTMDGQYHLLSQPFYLRRGQPEYPALARRKRQEGAVLLTVFINALGGLDKIEVKESSGFPLLDEAAIAAERKSRFRPAYVDNRPVPSKAEVPYRFKME